MRSLQESLDTGVVQALAVPVLLLHTAPIGAPVGAHVTTVTFVDGWRRTRYQLVPSQPPVADPDELIG
jgi:hypothetical protein